MIVGTRTTPQRPKPKRWMKRLLAILRYQSSPSKKALVNVFDLLCQVIKSPETTYYIPLAIAHCHKGLKGVTKKKKGTKRSHSNNHNHNQNDKKNKNKTVRKQKQKQQQNDYDCSEHQPQQQQQQQHVGSWPLVFSITFSPMLCAQAETHLLLRAKKMPVLSIALSSLTIMWTCKQLNNGGSKEAEKWSYCNNTPVNIWNHLASGSKVTPSPGPL